MRLLAGLFLLVVLVSCADLKKFIPLEPYDKKEAKQWP